MKQLKCPLVWFQNIQSMLFPSFRYKIRGFVFGLKHFCRSIEFHYLSHCEKQVDCKIGDDCDFFLIKWLNYSYGYFHLIPKIANLLNMSDIFMTIISACGVLLLLDCFS